MEWIDIRDSDDPSEAAVVAWLESLLPWVATALIGDIDALRELAAMGGITFDPDALRNPNAPLKPIVTDPDMYELRWTLLNKKMRQYHAEPASAPNALLQLKVHFKGGRSQQAQIEDAVELYRAWHPQE